MHLALGVGGSCRFEPTCSQYSREAFKQYGLVKGLALTFHRLTRCHPWGAWGIDTVQEETWRRVRG